MFLCCFVLDFGVKALDEKTAHALAFSGSVLAGGILGTTIGLKSNETAQGKVIIGSIVGVITAGLTWLGLSKLLFPLTPWGKIGYVEKIITLIEVDFLEPNILSVEISWPLVLAKENIMVARNSLIQASSLIQLIRDETDGKQEYIDLQEHIADLERKVLEIARVLDDQLSYVIKDTEYLFQEMLYDGVSEKENFYAYELST